jgi:hypothetical protein
MRMRMRMSLPRPPLLFRLPPLLKVAQPAFRFEAEFSENPGSSAFFAGRGGCALFLFIIIIFI